MCFELYSSEARQILERTKLTAEINDWETANNEIESADIVTGGENERNNSLINQILN
jgi:hypothetical protein